MSLRVVTEQVKLETKTKDNVFVTIPVSIQYAVDPGRVVDAYFSAASPRVLLDSYASNVILGHVPTLTLDDVFLEQSAIALHVKTELEAAMAPFGYRIVKALITDIQPDAVVQKSMNSINAAHRDREAAVYSAESKKIQQVKAAEAEAEAKALQGQGIANQRAAIIDGFRRSVEDLQEAASGISTAEVMAIILATNYYDALREIGAQSSTIFLPGGASGGSEVLTQITAALAASKRN